MNLNRPLRIYNTAPYIIGADLVWRKQSNSVKSIRQCRCIFKRNPTIIMFDVSDLLFRGPLLIQHLPKENLALLSCCYVYDHSVQMYEHTDPVKCRLIHRFSKLMSKPDSWSPPLWWRYITFITMNEKKFKYNQIQRTWIKKIYMFYNVHFRL